MLISCIVYKTIYFLDAEAVHGVATVAEAEGGNKIEASQEQRLKVVFYIKTV